MEAENCIEEFENEKKNEGNCGRKIPHSSKTCSHTPEKGTALKPIVLAQVALSLSENKQNSHTTSNFIIFRPRIDPGLDLIPP